MAAGTILLLGCNGQLGSECQRTLPALGNVVALDVPAVDFAAPDVLRELVKAHRPAIIVNAAAYTAVDKAESDPETAHTVNAVAPAFLADEAERLGAILVHYSTDYVFDGTKTSPYVETDPPNPLSVYGRTKLEGERAIVRCPRSLVFRTSWVIGTKGNNFVKTMLRLAKDRKELRVVSDQFGAPTSAQLLAQTTATVLRHLRTSPADDARWGLYHVVPQGVTNWNELARYVISRAENSGFALKAKAHDVMRITTAEYPAAARRPLNSRLDTTKLRSTFGIALPEWKAGLNEVLDQIIRDFRP